MPCVSEVFIYIVSLTEIVMRLYHLEKRLAYIKKKNHFDWDDCIIFLP